MIFLILLNIFNQTIPFPICMGEVKAILSRRALHRLSFFCAFWAALTSPLLPQNQYIKPITPRPFSRNYSTENSLPTNTFYTVFQDSKGFLWFGSQYGPIRFNGYTWEQFPAKEDINFISVFHFDEDEEGRIWMNTLYGNLSFLREDSIFRWKQNSHIITHRNRYSYTVGFEWEENKVHSFLSGLGEISIEDQQTDSIFTPDHLWCTLAYDYGKTPRLVPYAKKEVSAEMNDSLRIAFSRKLKPVYWPQFPDRAWEDFPVEEMTGSRESIILIKEGTYLLFRRGNLYLVENDQTQWHLSFPYDVTHFFRDRQGRIFFCTLNKKGIVWAESLQALRQGKTRSFLEGILFTNGLQDQQGGYWFTSMENGIFYCPDLETLIYDVDSGLPDEQIEAIAVLKEDSLFFVDRSYQLFLLDVARNQIHLIINPPSQFNSLYDIFYRKKERELWCATGEIRVFKQGQWTTIPLRRKNGETTHITVKGIHPSRAGDRIWFNGINGFAGVDARTKETLFHSKDLGLDLRTYSVFEDISGTRFAGVTSKTYAWKDTSRTDLFRLHPHFYYPVLHINQLPDSIRVFCPNGKGLLFQKTDSSYFSISKSDGLAFDQVRHTHVDHRGNLWAATSMGLNEISFNEQHEYFIQTYTTANGLPGNATRYVDSYENTIWVGTKKGLARFKAGSKEEKTSPPPFLEKVAVNGKTLRSKETTFEYNENLLSLSYLTLNYPIQGKIPYRYRLNQKDWIHTTSTTAQLSYLSPDEYTFEVQSQNEQGKWSESAVYEFVIQPPWWATIWFRSLAGIALLGLVFTGFRLRTRQLEQKHATQQQLQDLERSALQAQMNPHFIFNCLNSIQNFIAKSEKTQAATYLARFAALIRTALDASVEGKISLKEEVDFLKNYIELEKLRFKESFSFRIEVDPSLDLDETRIPPLLIQPYLENAVIHGMEKNKEGRINLVFQQKSNILEVIIRDNGPGIDHADRKLNPMHKSVGMTITQKRMELLKKGSEKGEVKIRELKGENGVIEGTEVRLFIGSTVKG